MKITIPDDDLKEGLEARLKTKISDELLKEFISYLEVDLAEWIHSNSKAFEVALRYDGRI
jgi:hypothetical protein